METIRWTPIGLRRPASLRFPVDFIDPREEKKAPLFALNLCGCPTNPSPKIHHPDHARRIAALETALSSIAFNRAMAKRAVEKLLALPPATLDANGESAA